jgi:hypothetical protein
MNITAIDEQFIRTFAQSHPEVLSEILESSAEAAHAEEDFFGDAFSVAMFVDFCKAAAPVVGGLVAVSELVDHVVALFKWARKHLKERGAVSSDAAPAAPPLAQRVLVAVFEAYVNRRVGLPTEALALRLGVPADEVGQVLVGLAGDGAIRKARDGTWKYQRQQ